MSRELDGVLDYEILTDTPENNIMLFVEWEYYQPDNRIYRQNSTKLNMMSLPIAIPVPSKYFYAASKESKILTIEGYKYVCKMLDHNEEKTNGNTQLPDDVMNGFDD